MPQLSMYGKLSWRKILTNVSKVLVQGSAHCSRESYPIRKRPWRFGLSKDLVARAGFCQSYEAMRPMGRVQQQSPVTRWQHVVGTFA